MANGIEEYHFYRCNTVNSLNEKQGLDEPYRSVSLSTTHAHNLKSEVKHFNAYEGYSEASLVILVPPENRFRYRYDTEMSGTHGSLQGIRSGREKSVPTVKLLNYPDEAFIRVSLVTCKEDGDHYPHPHSLFVKEKLYHKHIYENWENKCLTKTGHYAGPHYIKVNASKNDHTAKFEGMCIINSKKENFQNSIREKMQMRLQEEKYGAYKKLTKSEGSEDLTSRVGKAVNSVDVDFVSLCFEAFYREDGKLYSICPPVYSEPIGNSKSAKTGKLKISRINKCCGSCKGGDEIWMLVEKINKKGLIVRFWEEYNGKTIWESLLEGDDLILHHQYAIIFKIPAYKDTNISSEVEVLMRLERVTQPNQSYDFSEPITFVYEPLKNKFNKGENLYRKESILAPLKQIHIKRPRTDSSSLLLPSNYEGKYRSNELDVESTLDESTENDIEQLLFDDKDALEFDQAWSKFNVEEFLQFISSDDVDMPLQKDGVCQINRHRRDLLYKLYFLYSKLDENDIKKLTDEISNFKVSKKENETSKNSVEKDQVKDAASTLLSLRSKALVCNNNSGYSNNTSNNNNNNNNNNGSADCDEKKMEESAKVNSGFTYDKSIKFSPIVEPSGFTGSSNGSIPTSVIKNHFPESLKTREKNAEFKEKFRSKAV